MGKESKGEYKEFRSLLRRGIGTRTQKAFAEEVGISKEHLNRMLNNKEIARPTITVLRNMASHMETISEQMLLESCGYEIEPIEERAKRCEEEIAEGLKSLVEADYSQPWKSIQDAILTIDLLYLLENGKFEFKKEEANEEGGHHLAEKKLRCSYRWGDGERECITPVMLYYSRTENGNLIFLDYEVSSTDIQKKLSTIEERLLKAIFGDEDEKMVITTVLGYGFQYPETPAGFADFLNAYRGTFCTSKERSKMVLAIIDEGKQPDEVFAAFESDRYGTGTGGAVAEILSHEFGVDFYYYIYDEALSKEDSPSCILVDEGCLDYDKMNRRQFLLKLQRAAEALQIPQFGHMYHSYLMPAQERMYDTKSFGYEFKE